MDQVLQFKAVAAIQLVSVGIVLDHDRKPYRNPDILPGHIFVVTKEGHLLHPDNESFEKFFKTLPGVGILFRDHWKSICCNVKHPNNAPYYNSLLRSTFRLVKGKLPVGHILKVVKP